MDLELENKAQGQSSEQKNEGQENSATNYQKDYSAPAAYNDLATHKTARPRNRDVQRSAYFDHTRIAYEASHLTKGSSMSDFLNRMKAAAKSNLKTIVLPEGEDPRTIEAAKKIIDEPSSSFSAIPPKSTCPVPPSSTLRTLRSMRSTLRSSPSFVPKRA